MNFGAGEFVQLVLKRRDGAIYTVELTALEGHNISIGRVGNRTQMIIDLRADMGVVRYQPATPPQLPSGAKELTVGSPVLGEGTE